jgi:hypothetical protein
MVIRHRIHIALAAACIITLGAASQSIAQASPPGGVTFLSVDQDDDHMMQTWIGVAMEHYANALAKWLADASSHHGGMVSPESLSRFQQQLRRATFAHFEYTYVLEGVTFTRIYLAASGRGFATYINTRHTDLVAPDRPDGDYFAQNDVVTFELAGTPAADSRVTPQPTRQGIPNRGNDAEIKVLQAIIRDISEGRVGARGHLLGFVSKQPCESCEPALRQFVAETGAEAHVNYVFGSNQDGLRTPAWAALRHARESIVNDLVSLFSAPVAHAFPGTEDPLDDDSSSASVCMRP